jgi:hypothetical protein
MRRHLVDLIVLLVIATAVAGYLLLTEPAWRSVVLSVYIFVVGGLAMLALVAAAGDAVPRRRRSDLELALSEHDFPGPGVSVYAFDCDGRRLVALVPADRRVETSKLGCADLRPAVPPARVERTGASRAGDPATGGGYSARPRSAHGAFGAGISLDELRARPRP